MMMMNGIPKAALPLFPGAIVASVGLFGSLQLAEPIYLGSETGMSPATRIRIFNMWQKRATVRLFQKTIPDLDSHSP
jgi:hypothetical protein